MKPTTLLLACLICWSGLAGSVSVLPQTKPAQTTAQVAAVQVPFVGCASDGQAGPLAVPTDKSEAVAIPAALAQRLAYYKGGTGAGVLAPRGWHCFLQYGSDGGNLFVSPDPIDSTTVMSMDWKGFTGNAIELSVMLGGTSGRFEVAQIIARVFPAYKAFAQSVIAEGIEPASSFPFGPYPTDKLTYKGNNVVEFVTPANAQGLGTCSRLQANSSPIDGVAVLVGGGANQDTNLVQLSARLSATESDLIPAIVGQREKEAAAAAANQ